MRIVAIVAAAALLAAGCASAPSAGDAPVARAAAAPAPVASLAGTRWTGVVEGTPDPRTLPRLEFTQDRVAGFTGCNMLSGTWRMEEGAPHLGPLITTKRMCLGPEGEVEKRFHAAVGPSSRITREGDRLVFTAPSGARFEFREAAAG